MINWSDYSKSHKAEMNIINHIKEIADPSVIEEYGDAVKEEVEKLRPEDAQFLAVFIHSLIRVLKILENDVRNKTGVEFGGVHD